MDQLQYLIAGEPRGKSKLKAYTLVYRPAIEFNPGIHLKEGQEVTFWYPEGASARKSKYKGTIVKISGKPMFKTLRFSKIY